jgi:hypothetical protein
VHEKYGKHTVFLGASKLVHQSAQHDGVRGHLPDRRRALLPGATARKRLGLPMFLEPQCCMGGFPFDCRDALTTQACYGLPTPH